MTEAERVRAVADGRRPARRAAVSPFAHLLPLKVIGKKGRTGRGAAPVSFAHLMPGAARAAASRRAASQPVTTAVPPTTPEPMGPAERQAYRAAAAAENARWTAVMSAPIPPHLVPAAVSMLTASQTPPAAIIETLAMVADTTPPPPPPAPPAPRTGAERLAARVAAHRERSAAAQEPGSPQAVAAEADEVAEFGRLAARAIAKARDPNGSALLTPNRIIR